MTATEPTPIDLSVNITPETFDVTRHDCRITIENPATGQHRTFQIKTVHRGALEGKRVVSLLSGPCNDDSGDWQGFGFADEFGVKIWRKFRSDHPDWERTDWEVFARMLENPRKYEAKGAVYHIEARCLRCFRVLTTPTSISLGLGPECSRKV